MKFMIRKLRSSPTLRFFCIIVGFFLLFILLYKLFTLRYESNDDVVMMLISAGYFSDSPNHHLVFINALLGYLISGLEKFYPAFNWYSIVLVFIHILSFSAIFYLFTFFTFSNRVKWVFRFLTLAAFYYVSVRMQFTYVASFSCIAGLMLVHLWRNKLFLISGLTFFTVGGLLRVESALVILLFFYITYIFFLGKEKLKASLPALLFPGLLLLLVEAIDYQIYRNDSLEWAEYQNYNKVRGEINDNPQFYPFIQNELDESVHNKDQLYLFYNFFGDPNYIDIARARDVLSSIKNTRPAFGYMFRLHEYIIPLICIVVVFLIIIFYSFGDKGRKTTFFTGLLLIVYLGLLFYSNLYGRINARAYVAITAGLMFSLLIIFSQLPLHKIIRRAVQFLVISLGTIMFFNATRSVVSSRRALERNKEMVLWYETYGDYTIYPFPGSVDITNFKLLENEPFMYFQDFRYNGWLIGAPFKNKVVKDYRELLKESSVFLIRKDQKIFVERLIRVFSDIYGEQVGYKILEENSKFEIIKFHL